MALVQLAAKGPEDLYLTHNPQITFFKYVYKKHTIFTMEEIQQNFLNTPDFGKKTSCIINKVGDLLTSITLVITLPAIPHIYNMDESIDELTRFAWIKKIGFGIIKNIELKIGEMLIDNLYGEWINIWHELHAQKDNNIKKMIGDIEMLYEYSHEKQEYKLFIPLPFWFYKNSSSALPLLCLKQNTVELNLELQEFEKCHKISPTHYILMDNNICQYKLDEYIIQEYDDFKAIGQFAYFDSSTKKLYYSQISKKLFRICNLVDVNVNITDEERNNQINKYKIKGLTSNYFAIPYINNDPADILEEHLHSITYKFNPLSNIKISDCFVLVNYVFLGNDEKIKFVKSDHEYLIEQVYLSAETNFSSVLSSTKLNLQNPIKYIVWFAQQNYLLELYNNDLFNYTNSYQYNNILYDKLTYDNLFVENNIIYYYKNNGQLNPKYDDKQTGKSLIKNAQILLNATERIFLNDNIYFSNIESLEHFKYNPQNGLQLFSFSINPESNQPSGTCNMSQIDNIQINLILDDVINTNNTATFKCYSVGINILTVKGGYGGLLFVN